MTVVDDLLAAQAAAGGPLRVDEYLTVVLYGPHGFYTTAGHAGRRGDFITSAEVGPLFGAVLARWIDAEFVRQGEPAASTAARNAPNFAYQPANGGIPASEARKMVIITARPGA